MTVKVSEVPAVLTAGTPETLRRSDEPGPLNQIGLTNVSEDSPLTPLRFWFRSLPYQSWRPGLTVTV